MDDEHGDKQKDSKQGWEDSAGPAIFQETAPGGSERSESAAQTEAARLPEIKG